MASILPLLLENIEKPVDLLAITYTSLHVLVQTGESFEVACASLYVEHFDQLVLHDLFR